MTREGLKFFLNAPNSTFNFLIDEADSSYDALKKVKKTTFHLIIMDCKMEEMDADACVKKLYKYNPGVKILCVSICKQKDSINKMLAAGVSGFVYKNIDSVELLKAIDAVLNDKKYFCNNVALALIDFYKHNAKLSNKIPEMLSKRESEISYLIINEYSNREIAHKLGISVRTVGKHKENLSKKLKAKNMSGLINRIQQLNLSDLHNKRLGQYKLRF